MSRAFSLNVERRPRVDRRHLAFSVALSCGVAALAVALPKTVALPVYGLAVIIFLNFIKYHYRKIIAVVTAFFIGSVASPNFSRDRAVRLLTSSLSTSGKLRADIVDAGEWHGPGIHVGPNPSPLRYFFSHQPSEVAFVRGARRLIWSTDEKYVVVLGEPEMQGNLKACATGGVAVLELVNVEHRKLTHIRDYQTPASATAAILRAIAWDEDFGLAPAMVSATSNYTWSCES